MRVPVRWARWLYGAAACAWLAAAAPPLAGQTAATGEPPSMTEPPLTEAPSTTEALPTEPTPTEALPTEAPTPTEQPPPTKKPLPSKKPPPTEKPATSSAPQTAPPASPQEDVPAASPESPPAVGPPAPGAPEPATASEEKADEAEGGEEAASPGKPPPPRDDFLPRLDVYFPEGDLDLRVSRLINEVFFEGQVKYNFVDGDITAFLRYRYYGARRITQITAFDSIEFRDIEDFSSDFDRVRGLLVLLEWPRDYNFRTFALAEVDRIFSNIEALRFNNDTTNDYVRIGFQRGAPIYVRSNSIIGETRAQRRELFTVAREFGPGPTLTGALTYAFDWANGDYDYLKAEAELIHRFEVSRRTFLIGRLHAGSFLTSTIVREGPEIELEDRFSIPRAELFRLDGRDNLKGVGERLRGTEEVLTTWEYFFPWFLDDQRDFLKLEWQNWYWVLYSGLGTVGFDRDVYSDFDRYVPDVGLGFESSFRLRRKYRFFLSAIVAQALKGNEGVEAKISIKSYR